MSKTPQAPIAHILASTPSFDHSIPKCLLSCPSSTPPAWALINSCLEADTSSFTDHSLSPPALSGQPPSRPYSPLSWMPLTASFCQPALCVTGRTICFKNKSDQISPRPKNPETLLTASGGECVASCGPLASYRRTQWRRRPKGDAERTPRRPDPSTGLHSSGLTVVPVSGATTAVHAGHWGRGCQPTVAVCTRGAAVLSTLS